MNLDNIKMIDGNLMNPDGSINENTMVKLEGEINSFDGISHLLDNTEWTNKKKQWTFKKDITSAFAYSAVKLSPYAFPDNLEKVIGYLDACLTENEYKVSLAGMIELSLIDIKKILNKYLLELPFVIAWNDRKNCKEGNSFSCRYSNKYDADNDFIGLDALMHNACLLIRQERRAFKKFNDDFDKEHPEFKNQKE